MYAIQVEYRTSASRSPWSPADDWVTVSETTSQSNAREMERDYRHRGYPTRIIRYGETTSGEATSTIVSSNGQAPQDREEH